MKLNTKQIVTLRALAAFGIDGTFWPAKEIKPFETVGAAESRADMTDSEGNLAVRITEAGVAYLAELDAPANNNSSGVDSGNAGGDTSNQGGNTAASPKTSEENHKVSKFEIQTGIAIPSTSARAGSSVYPFEQLPVNGSFFVPATEDKQNPAKSLASTVASANARYSEVIEGETRTNRKGDTVPATRQLRQFVVRSVVENDVAGARVWRTL